MRFEFQVSEHEPSGQANLNELYQYASASADPAPRAVLRAANQARVDSFAYSVGKRILDLVLVALIAPVLVPMILLLAALVALTSPGSIFFSHRRICRHGEFFSMWKFRTMCSNSAEVLDAYLASHPEARDEWMSSHKLRYDPRVTPIGAFLRKYSLDELPQVWNVLSGEMSLVGPRPIVAAEVEKYAESFGCYTLAKPGVTGLWQVSGRSRTTYDERVQLDCSYVRNWSLWNDAKILSRTLQSVVSSDGAF